MRMAGGMDATGPGARRDESPNLWPEAMRSAAELPKRKVAFVELPDEAAGIVIHGYCDAGDWETALIVTSRPDSRSARIGRLLDVPILSEPTRDSLARCERVVVGDSAPETWATIANLLVGLPVEMLPLTQVLRESGKPSGYTLTGEPAVGSAAEPDPRSPAEPGPESAAEPGSDSWPAPMVEARSERPSDPACDPIPEPRTEAAGRSTRPMVDELRTGLADARDGNVREVAVVDVPLPGTREASRESAALVADSASPGFHAATILGAGVAGHETPLALDAEDPRVVQLLQNVLQHTRARTASLMLVDSGGGHLRVAAVQGHDAIEVRENRPEVGAGLAGRAFTTGQPQISRGVIPCLAEQVGGTRYRVSASCPVILARTPIGVLSINGESLEEVPDAEILRALRRYLTEACRAILSAVRIERIESQPSQVALQCLVDRLMSLEEALAVRIGFLAEALGKVLEADFVHSYLVDPMSSRLVPLAASGGMAPQGSRPQPISRGLFGWVVRHGIPQALESADEAGADRVATICYPIISTHPHSLIVLENVPLRRMSKDDVLRLLAETIEQVEGMIAVEEAMAMQDLVSELGMRIADRTADLDRLPPYHQTQAILDLALELTTAEAAVWIPSPGGQPTMSRPATRQAAGVLLEVWNHIEAVAARVRERGAAASGFSGEGWDPNTAGCPLPYIGVDDAGGEGVLLVFYSAQEAAGAPAQVPLHVLWKVLHGLCEKMPREGSRASAAPGRPRETIAEEDGGFVCGFDRFAERVKAEERRSRHSRRPLALVRVRMVGDATPEQTEALRAFLLRTRRDIDLLCTPEPGLFLLLWPEPEADPQSTLNRLAGLWAAEERGGAWEAVLRVFSGGEEEGSGSLSWLEESVSIRGKG